MIPIPFAGRLIGAMVLSSAVAFGGYKIGVWRESAAAAGKISWVQSELNACTADLATQREAILTGANHALEDELREATRQAHADAESMAKLATGLQHSSLNFAADTRALYEVALGGCSFTPDLVRLLNRAGAEANTANLHSPAKTAEDKTNLGDDKSAVVPDPSSRPR